MRKYNSFSSELPILHQIATELGLSQDNPLHYHRHPLSYLVESADDICYAFIDLEDGLELGLISLEQFEWALAPLNKIWSNRPSLTPSTAQTLHAIRAYSGTLRSQAIGLCVDTTTTALIEQIPSLLAGCLRGTLLTYAGEPVRETIERAKSLATAEIFPMAKARLTELGADDALHQLLDLFTQALFNRHQGQPETPFDQQVLSQLNSNEPLADESLYEQYRCALDYISGMTDHYALRLAAQLNAQRPKKHLYFLPFTTTVWRRSQL